MLRKSVCDASSFVMVLLFLKFQHRLNYALELTFISNKARTGQKFPYRYGWVSFGYYVQHKSSRIYLEVRDLGWKTKQSSVKSTKYYHSVSNLELCRFDGVFALCCLCWLATISILISPCSILTGLARQRSSKPLHLASKNAQHASYA